MWTTGIELVSIWHWILICLMLGFGLLGSFWNLEKKKSPIPIFFAIIVSIILFVWAGILEPLIFGFQYYTQYSIEWILVSYFGILNVILWIEIWFNNVVYGTVSE